jgi:hypothetical protein
MKAQNKARGVRESGASAPASKGVNKKLAWFHADNYSV